MSREKSTFMLFKSEGSSSEEEFEFKPLPDHKPENPRVRRNNNKGTGVKTEVMHKKDARSEEDVDGPEGVVVPPEKKGPASAAWDSIKSAATGIRHFFSRNARLMIAIALAVITFAVMTAVIVFFWPGAVAGLAALPLTLPILGSVVPFAFLSSIALPFGAMVVSGLFALGVLVVCGLVNAVAEISVGIKNKAAEDLPENQAPKKEKAKLEADLKTQLEKNQGLTQANQKLVERIELLESTQITLRKKMQDYEESQVGRFALRQDDLQKWIEEHDHKLNQVDANATNVEKKFERYEASLSQIQRQLQKQDDMINWQSRNQQELSMKIEQKGGINLPKPISSTSNSTSTFSFGQPNLPTTFQPQPKVIPNVDPNIVDNSNSSGNIILQ